MVDTGIPNGDPGIAAFQRESFGGIEVLSGDVALTTTTESVPEETDLPIYSVVGRDGNGDLIMAEEGVTAPVGILTARVLTTTGVTTTVDVYRTGMFNPDALNWDASYDTDAKKKEAFEGSVSPGIFIQKNKHQDPLP